MKRALFAVLLLSLPVEAAKPKIKRTALYLKGSVTTSAFRQVRDALEAQKGVLMVVGKPGVRRLLVTYDSRLKAARLIAVIRKAGHQASLTLPANSPWPAKANWRGSDMKVISKNGNEVVLEKHLARGKVTIFDFTADWCKPCALLDQRLAKLARRNKRVAARKIDVTQWDTPVVRQHLRGIKGLPYVEVFDRRGRRVTTLQIPEIWKIDEIVRPHIK